MNWGSECSWYQQRFVAIGKGPDDRTWLRGGTFRQPDVDAASGADTLSRVAHPPPHPARSLCASVHIGYMAPRLTRHGARRRTQAWTGEVCAAVQKFTHRLHNLLVKDRRRLQRYTMVAGEPEEASAGRRKKHQSGWKTRSGAPRKAPRVHSASGLTCCVVMIHD